MATVRCPPSGRARHPTRQTRLHGVRRSSACVFLAGKLHIYSIVAVTVEPALDSGGQTVMQLELVTHMDGVTVRITPEVG